MALDILGLAGGAAGAAFPWGAAIGPGLNILGGLFGLGGASSAQREQNRLMREALNLLMQNTQHERERQGKFDENYWNQFNQFAAKAAGYDPAAENRAAYDFASKLAGKAVSQGVGNANARYSASTGGRLGSGDTAFRDATDSIQRDEYGRLAEWAAQTKSQEGAKKLALMQALLQAAQGAPSGNLSNALLSAADMQKQMAGLMQPNFGPGAGMLGGGIQQLIDLLTKKPPGQMGIGQGGSPQTYPWMEWNNAA